MEVKTLNAKGKGEFVYDYENDMLLFKIKDRDYDKSIDFDNITIDIDTKGFITGLRVFDACKVLNLKKEALRGIKEFEFNAESEDKIVKIQLRFVSVVRNKPLVTYGQDFVREAFDTQIDNSKVVCTL